MKNSLKILTVLFISFSFFACDDVEDLLDITLSDTIVEEIPVVVAQTNGERATFSKSVSVSLDAGEFEEYLDKIKDVEIKSLSYKIINFSGDPTGDVMATFSVDGVVDLENSFVVKTAADNATIFEITDTDALNQLADQLKNNHAFTANYSGSALCDNDAMNFTVEITLDLEVIVNPLN